MNLSFFRIPFKHKILYVGLWMGVSFFLLFLNLDPTKPTFPQWIGNMLVIGFAVPACYYSAFNIMPTYLYAKKISAFVRNTLVLAFLNSMVTYVMVMLIYHLITGLPMYRNFTIWLTLTLSLFLVNIVLIAISCIIKIISDRYFMEQELVKIAKEKVTTELNFLRSQVNPHFLFNVMNTIYFQIDKGNTAARQSVEKFSEMLRYQLYECTTDKIQIKKELQYIQNYIAIQTLRMEKDSDIQSFIDPEIGNFFIAPLLILPLVENAFKHVSNFKDPGKNQIHLTIKKDSKNSLIVEVLNTYDQFAGQKHLIESGGLGIQNLTRRLELLYPNRYEVAVYKQNNIYKTMLKYNTMINCLVVDDEPIARSGMLEYIAQIDFLHLAGVCKNAIEATTVLQTQAVDLIFLDIQMPKISGIDFLKNLEKPPLIIFTTAYPEYAIEGYELNVLDYLLKPVNFERFFKAVVKAQAALNLKNKPVAVPVTEPYFFIKSNQKLEKIFIEDILYIEALSNYIILHTKTKKHIVYMSFKGIESQLPEHLFLKIHKSFIVAINAIQTIDNDEIILAGHTLPISKSYRSAVMEQVGKHLFKRQ